jgi:hypothetical protein
VCVRAALSLAQNGKGLFGPFNKFIGPSEGPVSVVIVPFPGRLPPCAKFLLGQELVCIHKKLGDLNNGCSGVWDGRVGGTR